MNPFKKNESNITIGFGNILVWKKNKKNAKLVSAEIDLNGFFGPKAAIKFPFFQIGL